ncbi:recombination-associated protein RdgC [Enterobacter hormaechei]
MKSPFPFFKNALVYRLSRDVKEAFQILTLHDAMMPFRFTPCGEHDFAKTGWLFCDAQDGEGQIPDIIHRTGDIVLTLVQEQRQIPASALKAEQEKRFANFEQRCGRKPKKPERDAIKDEVFQTLIPRAFVKEFRTAIWIDLTRERVVVDAGSAKQAEHALAFLRKTLGSLPVVPLTMETPIELTLTDWLKQAKLPTGITLSDKHQEAQFQAILEVGGKVAYRKTDIFSDVTTCLLDEGKVCTHLGVRVNDRIDLVINADGAIKKLVYNDELVEQNSDIDVEDQQARRYADFMLMTDELRNVIDVLVAGLGGEANR